MSPRPAPLTASATNDYQTPPEALLPLYQYLPKNWIVWECAEGDGNLSRALRSEGYRVVAGDIVAGQDFLTTEPEHYDCIVTNPPFSIKQKFLARAYALGKPFAFLLPLTTFETPARQQLFTRYGLEVVMFDKRINFARSGELPGGGAAWFATAWFTNWLGIGRQLTFVSLIEKLQGELL